ncbi:MAG: YggT family protein [Alphaproteobacteria bacterium]|nr:MAG: YggT family protein [Alphaproteobacteria bacterium]
MFITDLLILALTVYLYIIIASVIVNWMVMLQVLNIRNPIAKKINDLLTRATDPAYKRIQKVLPPVGGFDFSPLVLLIGITMLQRLLYGL